MKWEHKVNEEWMRMRRYFLCASDIRKLVPFTASGRPKKITDIDRIRILSNKLKFIGDNDCVSTGAAARGHILEPFAIEDFNIYLAEIGNVDMRFHHWDDVMIADRIPGDYRGMSFSPDGMNVSQDFHEGFVLSNLELPTNLKIVEVKSYSTEKHIICGLTNKMELEERWQIATAMFVCSQITEAYLLFYDPSCFKKMFVKKYTRFDLEDELEIIDDIIDEWEDFIDRMRLPDMESDHWNDENSVVIDGNMIDMYDIEKRLERASRFNP